MVQAPLTKGKRSLQCSHDFGSAGMTGKSIDIRKFKICASEDSGNSRGDALFGKRRNIAIENDAETLSVNAPTHYVQRVWPSVLAGHLDVGYSFVCNLQDACRRTVPEKRAGNDIGFCQLIQPERQCAQFNSD